MSSQILSFALRFKWVIIKSETLSLGWLLKRLKHFVVRVKKECQHTFHVRNIKFIRSNMSILIEFICLVYRAIYLWCKSFFAFIDYDILQRLVP